MRLKDLFKDPFDRHKTGQQLLFLVVLGGFFLILMIMILLWVDSLSSI